MISAGFAFAVALVCTLLITPLVRRLAIQWGAIDLPGGRRVNMRPVPRMGGVAIALSFFAALGTVFFANTSVANSFFSGMGPSLGLVLGGGLLCGVGVVDDLRNVRALHKLAAQVAAAGIAYAAGFRIEALSLPYLAHLELGWTAPVVTTLWIVGVVNAINLIDGLDGLAGGVTFFACVSNFVVAANNGDPYVLLLSAALGGAVLGFLFFNFNPASIFMGDSGSLFLGYVLATSSIVSSSTKSSTTVAILVPLIALGLPIMDTLLAIVRRVLRRQSIFLADRGHVHHTLLALGLTQRRAVLSMYGFCVFLTVSAIVVSIGRHRDAGISLMVLSIVAMGVIMVAGMLHQSMQRVRRRDLGWDEATNELRRQIPGSLRELGAAAVPADVAAVLQELACHPPLQAIILEQSEVAELAPLMTAGDPRAAAGAQNYETVAFCLRSAGAEAALRFLWRAERGGGGPEANILLQLVVDACDAALLRMGFQPFESAASPARNGERISASQVVPVAGHQN